MGQLSENGCGLIFKNGISGFNSLSNSEAHTGVFRDEDVVAWSRDGLHFGHKSGPSVCRENEGEEKIV